MLIYVGAVVVLLLFALMLTRAPIGGRSADLDTPHQPVAARGRSRDRAALLVVCSSTASATRTVDLGTADGGGAQPSATALFRTWVLPFEVLRVLLLAALVGAIVLSTAPSRRRRRRESTAAA